MNELELHDVFRYRGLGFTGRALYFALTDGPRTPRELEKTGVNRRTVFRKLKTMMQLGLVVNDGGLYSLVKGASLDGAARALGTFGTRERQLRRYAMEREAYRAWKEGRACAYQ